MEVAMDQSMFDENAIIRTARVALCGTVEDERGCGCNTREFSTNALFFERQSGFSNRRPRCPLTDYAFAAFERDPDSAFAGVCAPIGESQ